MPNKKECPYCGAEMREGFIPYNTPLWLKWRENDNRKNKIAVSDKVKLSKVCKISGVFYCDKCNIMIKHLEKAE